MTRELVVRTWCDLCPPESPQRGMTHRVALDGPILELDVCEAHEVALSLVDLAKTLAEHGREPESGALSQPARRRSPVATPGNRLGRKPKGERTLICLFCPIHYATPFALIQHMTNQHGLRTPDGKETSSYGLAFPTCPLCGKPQQNMIMSHCRKVHGAQLGEVWRTALTKPSRRGALLEVERNLHGVER